MATEVIKKFPPSDIIGRKIFTFYLLLIMVATSESSEVNGSVVTFHKATARIKRFVIRKHCNRRHE